MLPALAAVGMGTKALGNVVSAVGVPRAQNRALSNARSAYDKYYNQATSYYQPFADQAQGDMERLRSADYGTPVADYQAPEAPGAYQGEAFDFQADPGYQFRQKEGQKAIEAGAAARGNLFSSATNKLLAQYGQDMASQEYGKAYDRYQQDRQFGYNKYLDQYSQFQDQRNFGAQRADTRYSQQYQQDQDRYGRDINLFNQSYGAGTTLADMAKQRGYDEADFAMQQGDIDAGRVKGWQNVISGVGGDMLGMSGLLGGGGSGGGSVASLGRLAKPVTSTDLNMNTNLDLPY